MSKALAPLVLCGLFACADDGTLAPPVDDGPIAQPDAPSVADFDPSASVSAPANAGDQATVANPAVSVADDAARCTTATPVALRIDTANAAPIVSRDDYLDGSLSIDGADAWSGTIKIRGRGNTTWNMPKKPYRVKLDKSAALLGMPADRDWVLLANYADKTMLRDSVAFCIGELLDNAWVPRTRYVELTLNGEYQGLYQLSEQVEVGVDRVSVGELDGTLDAGYLLELDGRLDGEPQFVTSHGTAYVVQNAVTADQLQSIEDQMAAFEDALFGDDFQDSERGYAKYLDVDAMVDFFLAQELMRNNDAFFSSTYVFKTRGGKLTFGPLWDFDIAAGNLDYNASTEGFWVATMPYMARLLSDPAFKARVMTRWRELNTHIPELLRFIDVAAATLDAAQTRNFQRWDILNTWVWPNAMVPGSYAGEIAYLEQWLTARAAWLDMQYDPARCKVSDESADECAQTDAS